MFLRFLLKSKKGSTLMLSILMIIIMSLLGISLMAITLSSMKMSIFYSDLDKAYSLAEAAAEEIISNIDQKVADIQEDSRAKASDYLQLQLKENPISLRDPSGKVSLATSDTENVSKLEQAYEINYFDYFKVGLNSEFGALKLVDASKIEKMKELLGATVVDGNVVYKDLGTNKGRLILKAAQYDSINHKVTIKVAGLYNGYEKEIMVTLDLIAEKDNTPYQPIENARIKHPQKYDILKKAIVTEKNLLATGGNVQITGDVLSFGTIPVDENTQDENLDAGWKEYGGIMVGMCEDVAKIDDKFGFDSSKIGAPKYGKLNITGNAATLGYIHSIDSTSVEDSNINSRISITKNAFARSLRSERDSNFSTIELQNLTTLDNLQIDSSYSTVTIKGEYKGIVDTWHAIDGIGDGNESDDYELKPKGTSSVIVNGDSLLNFMGPIYIGGSTFFKNIVDANGLYPYMSGISVLKSTAGVKNAFMVGESSNQLTNLFWYVGIGKAGADEDGYLVKKANYTNYKMGTDKTDINMFSGINDRKQPEVDLGYYPYDCSGYFPLEYRGSHFKKLWKSLWKDDFDYGYSSYINPDNITIATNDGKLTGFSYGAIIANGTVYDCNDFVGGHDPAYFQTEVRDVAIKDYYEQVSGLLKDQYSGELPKLNFTQPTKTIYDYIDSNFVGTNRIMPNQPYVSAKADLGFVYYGTTDVDIKRINGKWYIGDKEMPSANGIIKGIIYVEGNIYVEDGFDFTGTLMSSKNIVFLGNATVKYESRIIDALLGADININGFFGLLTYEMPDEKLESQRISTKNTKIVKWNEIK